MNESKICPEGDVMSSQQLTSFLVETKQNELIQKQLRAARIEAAERCDGNFDTAYIDQVLSIAKYAGFSICRNDFAQSNTELFAENLTASQEVQLREVAGGFHGCWVAPLRCGLKGCVISNQLRTEDGTAMTEAELDRFLSSDSKE